VRPAVASDMIAVLDIEAHAFSDPWHRASFERLIGDMRVHFAVATSADIGLAGYVVAWYVMDEGEIANLAVALPARRRGIGGVLLDSAIAVARTRAVTTLYLEVRDSNQVARALYESRGFHQITRRRRYYRRPVEDALVLKLNVSLG
jgi:ribosomal-protein-alanine N-acetyltransferase